MIKPVEQLTLLGPEKRESQPVNEEVIRAQPSHLRAIQLAIQVSGREDKEVYMPLAIDKSTWSNILGGKFAFPTNKYEQLYDLTNEIPLRWLAYRRGYHLVPMRTEQERRIAELEEKNAELRKEIETLAKYGVIQRAKA